MSSERYELIEQLFESGRSRFYVAKHRVLWNEVMVRRLEVDPERVEDQRETFFREQRHAASLGHRHVHRTLDVYEEDGALWSVHDLHKARPSSQIVAERGAFPLAEAARLGAQAADALASMHERGFMHGRVAPGFLLVDERGDVLLTNLVKSADLAAGIWPLREAVIGLTHFSAPEEWRGEPPTPKSDLYGLAATILYWVTASDSEFHRISRHAGESTEGTLGVTDVAARHPELPPVLANALEKALEPDPELRKGSMAALASLLIEFERRHAAEVPAGFETGTTLEPVGFRGDVRLLGRHGAGRNGVVLRGQVTEDGTEVAVKALKPEFRDDRLSVERFVREARALLDIRHENIVRVQALGAQQGIPYVVMEFVSGPDLATIMRRLGSLPLERAVAMALGIARGLEVVHAEGLLHRDLKPHNILVREGDVPVITDFGVAKSMHDKRLTMTGAIIGTPLYMSPEQARGVEVGPGTDLYAFGAILYEMLSGRPPIVADDIVSLLTRVQHESPAQLGDEVPPPLRTLVERLLLKDPADRPRSAAEVLADLEAIRGSL